ncbi:hypothetical protein C3747_216g8 [Trypanosoma cruzi]|uniref:Uncharacterized protein n=2 Tax=Trypanosoma cruzi TaxID=5693 RepID=Q4CZD4_TRYCC|nr:hypothetical protein, conserved [Trypanosoma cruzi]EAN85632.1 hypothetical protein, conserved [Trypanosoma cruzi]PWU99621.1 hypothetical protein C3747_216g8 [Trypanosoma cruzi]RNC55625.1 hypothetical protein TcCL_ESM06893 [Trypanosoma cruzi]|eukprot:XP_807483.1 hypothetical protein [Trypanosoma cruzi strain CL Brener]
MQEIGFTRNSQATMSTSSSSSCANKRDVLNRVKEVLEAYVKSGVIDREDLKRLAKRSAEAIFPPAAVGAVDRATLQQLMTFLDESGAEEAVIAPIRAAEAAISTRAAVVKEETEKKEQSKTSKALVAEVGFSLTVLRERMAKKKEELRRQREEATVTVEQMPRGDASTMTASVALSSLPGETSRSSVAAADEPPTRKCKTEANTSLPLPSLQEVDLYADLEGPPCGWRTQLQPISM